jgi:hypothetical protein
MEIVNISYNGPGISQQSYDSKDMNLITKNFINTQFGASEDYIEMFVYDLTGNLINSKYNLTKYYPNSGVNTQTQTYSSLTLDVKSDLNDLGINRGIVNVQYNFLKNLFNSFFGNYYWIEEISNSRTEIKLSSQTISDSAILGGFNNYRSLASSKNYYSDFYLNFGNNELIIAVNAAYVEDSTGAHLLIKLYEPLPSNYNVKDTLWIVEVIAESISYNVDIQVESTTPVNEFQLRGPNLYIPIEQSIGQTTQYYNYDSLITSQVSSSYRQLKSYYQDKAISINVDYSNFSNFVKFSNITERINNFVYKLSLIENYQSQSLAQQGIVSSSLVTTSSVSLIQDNITNIIENFDNYEYFLYYSSASYAWPKLNNTKPYTLQSITSSQAINWLGTAQTLPAATTQSMLYSASLYDQSNQNALRYTVPQYILDDENNDPYILFLDMVGQHFDNIWVYYKDVTNRYKANNNPYSGISIDQVADALRGLGIKLYTNTSISDNLYYTLFGTNPDGTLLPPTGSELINTYITSSIQSISANDLQKEFYKRIYHNLPYLLKSKGTQRAIKAIVCSYGIPDSILTVNEFGGYNSSTVSGLLEINNDKVIIATGSNYLLETQLSKDFTIERYSDLYRPNSPIIEVGFSPTNTVNNEITASLGYFNIDQLVGKPNDQYSRTYPDLNSLRDNYFSAYTRSKSVWEYIRLIKYYNNSLFKMIKDFVPARSEVSTGIIIKSHVLERNKYERHEPSLITASFTSSGVDMLDIVGSDAMQSQFSSSYTNTVITPYGFVNVPNDDGLEKYTGTYSGSQISGHSSEFLQYDRSFGQTYTSSVSVMVPLDYLLNNVSSSVRSTKYLDLDFTSNQLVPVNYNAITKSILDGPNAQYESYTPFAELQDYNYHKISSINARYAGSKLQAKVYNAFTNKNNNYEGDLSFGSYPAIERTTNKLGFFTQVQTSSFFPGKVNVTLAYLADISGGLFELNQNNNNWEDVQNIFVAGGNSTIKQFDNRKYRNQSSTDGIKLIHNSGYNYSPQLYFTTSSDARLYFEYLGGDDNQFRGYTIGSPNSFISGPTGAPTYAVTISDPSIRAGAIYNYLDGESPASNDFAIGKTSESVYPNYTASIAGQRTFAINLKFNIEFPNPQTFGNQTVQYSWGAYKNNSELIGNLQTAIFQSQYSTGATNGTIVATTPSGTITLLSGRLSGPFTVTGPFNITKDGVTYNSINGTITWAIYTYKIGNGIPITGPLSQGATGDVYSYISSTTILNTSPIGASTGAPINISNGQISINYTTPGVNLIPNDKIIFRLTQDFCTTSALTSSLVSGISNSYLTTQVASTAKGNYPYAISGSTSFITSITENPILENTSVINFNSSLAAFINYLFIPTFETGSTTYSNSLYGSYGYVNYPFNPQFGDKIVMQDLAGNSQELNVYSASTGSGILSIVVYPKVLDDWSIDQKKINTFLLLKQYEDEQNVILTFNKQEGKTSYGFLIPDTINKNVINQINSIQASVQSQILSTQANSDTLDAILGGTFGG